MIKNTLIDNSQTRQTSLTLLRKKESRVSMRKLVKIRILW